MIVYKLVKKILLSCFLLIGFLTSPFGWAVDSTIIGAPNVAPLAPPCSPTSLSEPAQGGYAYWNGGSQWHFYNFNDTAHGGKLCPGKYYARVTCTTYNTGGCGGDSCGWSMVINDNSGNQLSHNLVHSGEMRSWGNTRPGDGDWNDYSPADVIMSPFTYDTNVNRFLYVTGSPENGWFGNCAMTVVQVP